MWLMPLWRPIRMTAECRCYSGRMATWWSSGPRFWNVVPMFFSFCCPRAGVFKWSNNDRYITKKKMKRIIFGVRFSFLLLGYLSFHFIHVKFCVSFGSSNAVSIAGQTYTFTDTYIVYNGRNFFYIFLQNNNNNLTFLRLTWANGVYNL